jgi:hypothetical protein
MRFPTFNPRLGLMRLLILISALGSATGLQACAAPRSAPTILLPQTFREACQGPTGSIDTVGDLGAMMIRQEASLASCEAKRAGIVSLVDAAQAPKPRPWWDRLIPGLSSR